MALDHYVSQVHLRNFYSPALGNRMYAVRKSDGKAFTPTSESVCRIEAGSTNDYLSEDRAIEEFLKGVEPQYNASVKKVAGGEADPQSIYVIAGFVAYVNSCSPAGMRIHADWLRASLESSARELDAAGMFPPVPESFAGATLTELLRDKRIGFNIDPKYPQAIGIVNILKRTSALGNCAWDILHNPFVDSPFFTSDYPAAIECANDPRIVNTIVALTPTIAIRVRPDLSVARDEVDFGFPRFKFRVREIRRPETLAINRLLVKCAEDTVFYRDDNLWVKPFVAKYATYGIEAKTQEFLAPGRSILLARQRIVERRPNGTRSRSNSSAAR